MVPPEKTRGFTTQGDKSRFVSIDPKVRTWCEWSRNLHVVKMNTPASIFLHSVPAQIYTDSIVERIDWIRTDGTSRKTRGL